MLIVKAFDSKIIKIVTCILLALYFMSMFIIPLYTTDFDWNKYQRVLYSWQSLNIGVLAFIASIIALSISKYNEEKQREREFTAAKALLPNALCDLCDYLKKSSNIYITHLEPIDNEKPYSEAQKISTPPELADDFIIIFKECIRHSPPEIGKYLANILQQLQVHKSRIQCITNSHRRYILSCIYETAALQSKVNLLFNFARNEEGFDKIKPLNLDSLNNSYKVLGLFLDIDTENELNEITKKQLARL
ncbi:hypothetical protein [Pseudoalteromonas sp. SG45-1]|uniref:hypothetical protein n=1 Tax=Pseudoalteromonas sp. SG45-1 TaxID=2760957 RepID=UPI0016000B9E|nr:hypothetical protein [Pseudoalteromonas sp. SG45-1]MBB1403721.1 hypothetical protein [Pseudoalteromonas sp. SG45-1]